MDAASASGQEQQGRHKTVCSEPPKRPTGHTKFHETRHPVYRGMRRRGRVGQWVCEMHVHGTRGSRLWLGTFATAALVLSGLAACLNFPDSAWRMLPVLAAGSFGIDSVREIKAVVALAVVALQLRPVAESSLIAVKHVDDSLTPSTLFYMLPGDLLELDNEKLFGGMVVLDN
ncbi:hypothetical protein ACQ4PT_036761 [Festuca glaucescens]